MPELVEVEYWRSLVERSCCGKIIHHVHVSGDSIVLTNGLHVQGMLQSAVGGCRIEQVQRRGKHLWWKCVSTQEESIWYLCFHFAMSGGFLVQGKAPLGLKYHEDKSEGQWPPLYWKCWFELEENVSVAFTNVRRFGRVRLVRDIMEVS